MITDPDGALQAAFGVMGGFMQPQGHLQVVSALVDDAVDPQAALDRPRFQLAAGSVAALPGAPVALEEGLEQVAGGPGRPRSPGADGGRSRTSRVRARTGDLARRGRRAVGRQRPARRRLRPGSAGMMREDSYATIT